MNIRDEVRRLAAYRFEAQPAGVKLDQNEFPADLPPELRERALDRLSRVAFHRYPEIHANSLRAAIADLEGWDPAGIVLAGGSNVLIQAVTIAAGVGRRLLTVRPTFSVYGIQGRLLALSVTEVPLGPEFELPTEALVHELSRGEGVLFVADPAAPTGNRHDPRGVRALVEAADPERWTVVLDEAYWQFSGRHHGSLVREHAHVISLRTLSKAYGLGGVRLGYALAQPDVAAELQKVLLPFSVSALQVAVGLAALEDRDLVQERVRWIVSERERVAKALHVLHGVTAFPSDTNFLLVRVADADAVYDGLLERGVIVRKQHGAPGLDGCLRVSIGRPEDNDRFLDALQTGLAEEEIHV